MAATRSRDRSLGRGGLALLALGLVLVALGVSQVRQVGDDPSSAGTGAAEPDQRSVEPFRVAPTPVLERAPTGAKPSEDPEAAPPAPPPATAAGLPVRLVVPELGIDSPVVGIKAPGAVLTPPSDPQVLGWWSDGARPGAAAGGALITGHTVSSGGGAFDHLETLDRGDRVRVRTTNGTIDYEVTGTRIYRKATLAQDAERIFSQSVPGRLVLITCEDWNGTTYLSNVVVYGEPIVEG